MRGDDGLGPVVARRLRLRFAELGWSDVQAVDAGTDGMGVMFAARGSDALVIVDAARTGIEPGGIDEVPSDVLAREYVPSLNLHDFRWQHALAAGRRMFGADFPGSVSVLLVEVDNTGFGLSLSPTVRAAADALVARIIDIATVYHDTDLRARA